jgi:hypothetical protein
MCTRCISSCSYLDRDRVGKLAKMIGLKIKPCDSEAVRRGRPTEFAGVLPTISEHSRTSFSDGTDGQLHLDPLSQFPLKTFASLQRCFCLSREKAKEPVHYRYFRCVYYYPCYHSIARSSMAAVKLAHHQPAPTIVLILLNHLHGAL